MTDEQRTALRENLYNKSVKELVETILDCYDELEEAKQIRRRFKQIQNLLLDHMDEIIRQAKFHSAQ